MGQKTKKLVSAMINISKINRLRFLVLNSLALYGTVSPGVLLSQESVDFAKENWNPPSAVKSMPANPPAIPRTVQTVDSRFDPSAEIDDTKLRNARVLGFPLIRYAVTSKALNTPNNPVSENRSVADALAAYQKSGGAESVSGRTALEAFLDLHPSGSYAPSVRLELSSALWRTGWWEKSIRQLEAAWAQSSQCSPSDVEAHRFADVILSELLKTSALLGRKERIRTILKEIADRHSGGDALNSIHRAKEILWFLDNRAEQNILCGFSAANLVCVPRGQKAIFPDVHDEKEKQEFISKGVSLWDIAEHSAESGGDLQCVLKTDPKAPLAIPSVIHWKLGHFSALTGKDGDGRIHLEDAMMKYDSWVEASVLAEESSGYALLPKETSLPKGYRLVEKAEAREILGRHCVHGFDDEGCDRETGDCGGGSKGMATYSLNLRRAYANIIDTPISYASPDGSEVEFTIKHSNMPPVSTTFNTYGFGTNWFPVFGGGCIVLQGTGVPNSSIQWQTGTGSYNIYTHAGSGNYTKKQLELPSISYLAAPSGPGYRVAYTDGSYFDFTTANTNPVSRYLLTRQVDSNGATTLFGYDSSAKLLSITDSWGKVTVFSYIPELGDLAPAASYPSLVRRITDPFGRYATFLYDVYGNLVKITDPIGIVSEFTYGGTAGISKLKTPYGETSFIEDASYGMKTLVTDPRGFKEQIIQKDLWSYRELDAAGNVLTGSLTDFTVRNWNQNPDDALYGDRTAKAPNGILVGAGLVGFLPKNNNLGFRNSFYWDKKAMYHAPEDWNAATVYNWKAGSTSEIGPALSSSRTPGNGRIWYNYPGQAPVDGPDGPVTSYQPSKIVRQVENESGTPTWVMTQRTYNAYGLPLLSTDEKGRQIQINYDTNQQDVLNVQALVNGTWVSLKSYTYAPSPNNRLPATITEVSGLVTTYNYNARGQVTGITTSKGGNSEAVRYTYSASQTAPPAAWPGDPGYVRKIEQTSPANLSAWVLTDEFSYDTVGRVRSHKDAGNYETLFDYDNFDRLTLATHPDGTTLQFAYRRLDLEGTKDRAGRWSRAGHNAVRQPVVHMSPDGKITQYDWCLCGQLQKLTDAAGRETKWTWAPGGFLMEKFLPDGVKKTTYTYQPNSGRLSTITQPNDQASGFPTTTCLYDTDGKTRTVNYTDPATPDLTFNYEPNNLGRLTSVVDGIGTHNYVFVPLVASIAGAGQLDYVDGPLTNDRFRNVYDWQNRVGTLDLLQDTLVSPANLRTESYTWDSLGRPASIINTLGNFTMGYNTALPRPDSISGPFGISTVFTYQPNTAPGHSATALLSITHSLGATQLARHIYGTDKGGRITSWQQESNSQPSAITKYDYSLDDELLAAEDRNLSTSALIDSEKWGFDKAGNWLSHTRSATSLMETRTHDNLNRLNQIGGAGSTLVEGTVNELSTVTVNNQPAELRTDPVAGGYRYRKTVPVTAGSNTVQIKAIDKDNPPNTTQKNWQFTVPSIQRSFNYDNNGNTMGDGLRTYTWDAKNRLKTVTQGGVTWKWDYDFLDRRVREYQNNVLIKIFIWAETSIAQERNAANAITRTHYDGGFSDGPSATTGTKYQTLGDHLGNVREVITSAGSVAAVYDYTPYQGPVKISGSVDATKLTIGEYYHHDATGLELTLYRAYDPALGRWLSPDPIEEMDDINMYGYVNLGPISNVDELGLAITEFDEGSSNLHVHPEGPGPKKPAYGIRVMPDGSLEPCAKGNHPFNYKEASADLAKRSKNLAWVNTTRLALTRQYDKVRGVSNKAAIQKLGGAFKKIGKKLAKGAAGCILKKVPIIGWGFALKGAIDGYREEGAWGAVKGAVW